MFEGINTGVKRLLIVVYLVLLGRLLYEELSKLIVGSQTFIAFILITISVSVIYWGVVAVIFWIYRGFRKKE